MTHTMPSVIVIICAATLACGVLFYSVTELVNHKRKEQGKGYRSVLHTRHNEASKPTPQITATTDDTVLRPTYIYTDEFFNNSDKYFQAEENRTNWNFCGGNYQEDMQLRSDEYTDETESSWNESSDKSNTSKNVLNHATESEMNNKAYQEAIMQSIYTSQNDTPANYNNNGAISVASKGNSTNTNKTNTRATARPQNKANSQAESNKPVPETKGANPVLVPKKHENEETSEILDYESAQTSPISESNSQEPKHSLSSPKLVSKVLKNSKTSEPQSKLKEIKLTESNLWNLIDDANRETIKQVCDVDNAILGDVYAQGQCGYLAFFEAIRANLADGFSPLRAIFLNFYSIANEAYGEGLANHTKCAEIHKKIDKYLNGKSTWDMTMEERNDLVYYFKAIAIGHILSNEEARKQAFPKMHEDMSSILTDFKRALRSESEYITSPYFSGLCSKFELTIIIIYYTSPREQGGLGLINVESMYSHAKNGTIHLVLADRHYMYLRPQVIVSAIESVNENSQVSSNGEFEIVEHQANN